MRHLFFAAALLAACARPETPQAAGPAALDTAAVRTALQALSDSYAAALVAGDVAAVTGHFTEDATAAYFGFPTTTGRANIQGIYATLLGIQKVTAAASTVGAAGSAAPGLATAGGTFHETVDSSGVTIDNWWRWASAYRQEADGQWRIAYIMAFPDSTSRK
jgi:ketosteroid isomerase-like protein